MQDPACEADYHASPAAAGQRRRGNSNAVALRFAVERMAFGVRRAQRSLWFHGADVASFEAAGSLVGDAIGGRADVALVVTAPSATAVAVLRRRFPDDLVLASPWAGARSVERFLARLRPCALVLLDGGRSLGRATMARLLASPLPIFALAEADDGGLAPALVAAARAGRANLRICHRDRPAADVPGAGRSVAVSAGRSWVTIANALRSVFPAVPDAPVTASALPVFPETRSWYVPTLRDRVGQSRPWKAVAPLLMRRRIDDWPALRQRLSRPRSVLCLGNGPSSEDPRLAAIEHDCLIRVNWRWRERGLLDRPDIVFVGDAATIHRVPPCIFGLWSARLEYAMLLRHLAMRGLAAMEYITLERLSALAVESRWPARPSNGALAILTAAALAPERLIIGGMDLFAHPAGRYPGEPRSRNAYSPSHDVDTELALIDLALRDYRGEVVIVGPILGDALERYRERARRAA